jgi:plastocyanin
MRGAVTFAAAAFALVGASGGSAVTTQTTKLVATVGPEFNISLVDTQGNRVTKLDPGPYEIEVRDRSDFHNFHLRGPGVDQSTDTTFTGDVTWQVTFRDGTYTFLCDVHPTSMRGTFTAGTPPIVTAPSNAITPKTRLVLTSGPAFRITLKTTGGKAVKTMTTGTYAVTVRDRSSFHNAHVIAPGVNKKTTVPFVGTERWRLKLSRPGTLRFLCDPHASQGMRGSAKIVR